MVLNGYDFISEKILSCSDMVERNHHAQSVILNYAFNTAILIKDYRQFFTLAQMFKAIICVVYCDPKDKKTYNQVLDAMISARK